MARFEVFLDTSVLVAAADERHIHHAPSHALVLQCSAERACCGAHNLAEFYSTVTRIPGAGRLSPQSAIEQVAAVRKRLALVALTGEEQARALGEWSRAGVAGGAIYDAMIASCALKAGVRVLYTWNVKDFARLGPRVAEIVRTP